MDNCNYPRTVEEMLDQGWYEKILRKVKQYKLNDILNTPEEITQDIFLQIMKSDYLARYNPDMRTFEVYIFVLVENSIKKRGMREGTTGGRNIVNHYSLEQTQDEDDNAVGVAYLDRLPNMVLDDQYFDIYMNDLIERTRESLKEFEATSSVMYGDTEIFRDPLTVFNYILEGLSVPEIAEILQTSKQFVYILLAKIRETPEMVEFHKGMARSNAISSKGKRRKKTIQNAFSL